jgi:hypothetical protein
MDFSSIGGDKSIDEGSVFSPKMLVIFAICLVVGIVFGVAFMSGQNANALLEMRTADAKKLRDAVKPKIADFNSVAEKIGKMSSDSPDGELAKELAAVDFALPGAALASVRIPLPGSVTDTVAQFAADTKELQTALDEHARLTNKVDAEEIKALLENNKALQENKAFGVIYDVEDVRKNSDKDNYQPKRGRLVGVKDYDKENNQYVIELLGSGDERKVPPEKIVPLEVKEILKTGGQNALHRYKWRVRNIKYLASKISKYSDSLQESLDRTASGEMDSPGAAPAAEEAPAEE